MNEIGPKVKEVNENKIAVAAAIIPFSIIGVLIRVELERLENFSGAPVFGLVYAQWIGCFIMGIAATNKNLLFSWYHPSHPGISTGLCGSITTFSSWQLAIFKEFANYYANPHTRGKNILAAISQFLVTLAMSLNGLRFGQHVGQWFSDQIKERRVNYIEPKVIPRGFSLRYLTKADYLLILFGIMSWLGVLFAAIFAHYNKALALSCVFAPVGALTRWYLSFDNGRIPCFPIGTFIANIFGTTVLAALGIVNASPHISSMACSVVQALADGFCGCLTTISTFMVELTTLTRKHSYIYGFISVVISQCCMFIIMGSYIWSRGKVKDNTIRHKSLYLEIVDNKEVYYLEVVLPIKCHFFLFLH
ncbi:CrcB-like protein-domain-containing protein [Cokeromyces recurvatus]|uniref:CrcB-like protein-domain-containing protein n=1 Tax=Cokeromyces recurvatus TaxID=90255 RepID=UPI002220045E|nr:CrcB-like protein-domain-containing protein [Cokeromyces recurvatus]KAI7905610.1 CrcB-like protein-domain-containing protein [Cokeromyces recurvatus]